MLVAIRDRFLLALQYQDYRTLWIANASAGAASWALIIARGWLAFEITGGSSLWAGIVTGMVMVPRVFATPIVGFLADRFDRQTLLSWTYTLNLAHNIVLSILVMLGMVQGAAGPWILVVLALINGTLRTAQQTTTQTLVPNLVPREHLPNAIALNEATQQGSRFTGALAIIIAVQLGIINISAAFWISSALYAIGLFEVYRIGTRSRGRIDRNRSFFSNLVAGFVYVYQRPLILSMILLVLAHCAFTMSYEALLPAISQQKLGSTLIGVSYLLAGVGGGALLTSLLLAGIRSDATRGKLFLLFGLLSGLSPLALALSSNWELSIAAVVGIGATQAGFMTITHTIIQTLVDDGVRGRVSGVYSVHVGGSMAVTNMINGGLADFFTASSVMAVGGGLFILAILASMGSVHLRGIYFPRLTDRVAAA